MTYGPMKGETPTIVGGTQIQPAGRKRVVLNPAPPSPVPDPVPPAPNSDPLPQPTYRMTVSQGQQNILVAYSNGQRVPAIWGSNVQTGGLMMGPWIVNGNLVIDYIVCHGPIGAMTFTLDGKTQASLNAVMASNVYLGTASQGVDPLLANVPGWTSALPGLAHVAIQLSPPAQSGISVPNAQAFLAQVTQGLLVREPRENMFTWSGDLSNAAWIKGTGMSVAQSGTGPDGNPAWQLTDSSNTLVAQLDHGTYTVPNDSAPYRLQIRIKKTTGGTSNVFAINYFLSGGTLVSSHLRLNTDTGGILGGNGWTISTDPLDSNWWLCQGLLTNNSSGNTVLNAQFFPCDGPYNNANDDGTQTGSAVVAMPQLTSKSAVYAAYGYTASTALTGGVDANGIPNQPRAFSDNPALIWADFKTSQRYGAGYPDAEVNWDSWSTSNQAMPSVAMAADDCDVIISSGAKRYRMGWKLDPSQSLNADSVENTIRQHFFGSIAFYNGKWNVWVNKAQSATGQVFQDHTGPGGTAGSNIVSARWRQKGASEVPTMVRVHYVDSAANYQDASAEDDDPGLTSGANPSVQYVPFEYSLGVPTYDQAKRLAIQYRNQGLLDKEYWIIVGPEGMKITPGCVVTVYSQQCNVSNQQMLVIDIDYSPASNTFQLHSVLYNAATYSDVPQTGSPSANPLALSPLDSPPEIVDPSITLTASVPLISSGPSTMFFSAPQIRSTTKYGGTSWSQSGGSGFTAAAINDGVTTVAALTTANNSTLTLDAGSAITLREFKFWSTASLVGTLLLQVDYADAAGGPWTTVTQQSSQQAVNLGGGIVLQR